MPLESPFSKEFHSLNSENIFKYELQGIVVRSETPVKVELLSLDKDKTFSVISNQVIAEAASSAFYKDYQPTWIGYDIPSPTSVELTISFANRLPMINAKHSIICKEDSLGNWVPLETKLDVIEKTWNVIVETGGRFVVFTNQYWYSSYTQNMANEYPSWTRIQKSKESLGQRFLNFFGLHFDEIKEYLNWIHDQKFIGAADIQAMDWIYSYDLVEVKQTDTIVFTDNATSIKTIESIRDFFYNESLQGGIIDYEKRKFYSINKYENFHAKVTRGTLVTEFDAKPVSFHVWNSMDEFGLLVGVKRLYLEKNREYKERILDAFRYPANTSDEGLTNGIARELNMIMRSYKDVNGNVIPLVWKNDSKSFFIKNRSGLFLDIRTLRVDGKRLEEKEFKVDPVGNILIYPRYEGKEHQISFIYGLEKHELHDRRDEDLYKMMYTPNAQATSKLLGWVEYINTVAPVMWDRFKWDEGFWDTIDKKLTGLGYIPNMWDSDIEIWKTYTFDPKRWESETIWAKK